MAEFVASPIPNPGIDAQGIQANALSLQAGQQALTDRQTFRDNSAGLIAGDTNAKAAALGADPIAAQNYLNSIPNMDANTRAQAATDLAASGSLAGAVLNAPPDQRAATWAVGRQQLIASGHKMVPGETYPGDGAMLGMRGLALTAQEQFAQQNQVPTTDPASQYGLRSVPGGGNVGPGGAVQQPGVPLPAPDPQSNAAPAQGQGGLPAIAQPLAKSENPGGNPATMNKQGYVGNYQFGSGRLSSLGLYQPAQGENPNGNTWQGQFNIPGFPQVRTLADFRASPAAQNAAFGTHINDIDSAIAATPGAQNFDQNGLRAVAHLGGVGGMQKFVASGGQFNPHDSNLTSLSNYYQKFSAPPTQVAQNGAGPQVANDASPAAPAAPAATVGQPTALQADIDRLRTVAAPQQDAPAQAPSPTTPAAAPAVDPNSIVNVDNLSTAGGFPAGTPMRTPDGQITIKGAAPAPTGQPISTPAAMAPDVPQASGAQPGGFGANGDPAMTPGAAPGGMNPLASLGSPAPAAPNALLSAGQPQGPVPAGPPQQAPQNALAPPPAAAQSQSQQSPPGAQPIAQDPLAIQPGDKPVYVGANYQPGPGVGTMYVMRNGVKTVVRVPGAPGAGVDTKIEGGSAISTDKQTGQVTNVTPGLPDSSRMVTVPGPDGTQVYQSGRLVRTIPFSTQPAQIHAWEKDQDRATAVAQQSTDAEQQIQRALEGRNLAQGLPTGSGGETRQAISTWLKTYASPGIYDSFIKGGYLPDAPQAEEAAKVMLGQAALDEKTMGGSGGLGLTEKYAKANPSLNMTPQAIRDMSNLKAITAQSVKDYGDGFLQSFNEQQDNILHNSKPYQPASNFDQKWHSQANVQDYLAAIGAMNGKPYSVWSQGISNPAEEDRIKGIIARVDPTTIINGKNGQIGVVKASTQVSAAPANAPAGVPAPPAVGTVMQGHRFMGGDPSSPASWQAVQ